MRFPASSRQASILRMCKLKYSELKTITITTIYNSLCSTVTLTLKLVPNKNVSGSKKPDRRGQGK